MLQKTLLSLIVGLIFITSSLAQNTLAKIEYSEAETDFQVGQYAESLQHLETVKEMLGNTNAKVMYLEILCRDKISGDLASAPSTQDVEAQRQADIMQSNNAAAAIIGAMAITGKIDQQSLNALTSGSINLSVGQPSRSIQNTATSSQLSTEGLKETAKNIKTIEALSSYYIANFENDVPIEKLTEIYNINKKYKDLITGIDDVIKGSEYLENGEYAKAKLFLSKGCQLGSTMGCNLLLQVDVIEKRKAYTDKISSYDGVDNVKLKGLWNQKVEMVSGYNSVKDENRNRINVDKVQKRDWSTGNIEHLAVMKNGKYGAVDPKKQRVDVPIIYDAVLTLPDSYKGFTIVKMGDKHGLVDEEGKESIPLEYDDMGTWGNGALWVEKGGKFGVVRKSNKIQVPIEYDFIGHLEDKKSKDNYVRVMKDGKWGWMNANGEIVVDLMYDETPASVIYYKGQQVVVIKDGDNLTITL